ncbi:AraC family transcriptional regulator [Sciscionella sediminilitoris]|uniref:AraC family transcriptional regulator n=1 Tax=Sciscionella sediminilitoris TaxID=1445613 RepID=UPI0004DF5A5D|nr:AraC family transcriptional regulator [Sciscionella sp. SE31]
MDPPGLIRFRTGDLPRAHRLAAWEEHNARSLLGLRARALDDRPFEGTELNLRLPRLGLARVSGSPHVVRRDPDQIARHPAEGIVVYFALAGEGRFRDREGTWVLHPGQALVCDADRPFRRGFPHGLTELVLTAPRTALRETAGRCAPAGPRVFGFRDGVGKALASAVTGALAGHGDWETLESTVLGLLAGLLGAPATDRLAAARAYIDAHLHEPELSASRIAAAAGYSERQLSRLFAESGQSVPQAVLAARLDAARSALTDRNRARTPIAELATRHGFASPAHFSRSYRARFGSSPLRDRARR